MRFELETELSSTIGCFVAEAQVLGVFAKFAKSECFLRHVYLPNSLSVCMEQLSFHSTEFHEN
jgi:hypothetical protein